MAQIITRSGLSFARSPDIENYLTPAEIAQLNRLWETGWPCTIHSGGTREITCADVKEVGEQLIVKVFGKKFGNRLLALAKGNDVY